MLRELSLNGTLQSEKEKEESKEWEGAEPGFGKAMPVALREEIIAILRTRIIKGKLTLSSQSLLFL